MPQDTSRVPRAGAGRADDRVGAPKAALPTQCGGGFGAGLLTCPRFRIQIGVDSGSPPVGTTPFHNVSMKPPETCGVKMTAGPSFQAALPLLTSYTPYQRGSQPRGLDGV